MVTESLTSEDLEQALIDYFSEPDVSDCFTVPMVQEQAGISRHKARARLDEGLKSGAIEYVTMISGTKYFRFVGKSVG